MLYSLWIERYRNIFLGVRCCNFTLTTHEGYNECDGSGCLRSCITLKGNKSHISSLHHSKVWNKLLHCISIRNCKNINLFASACVIQQTFQQHSFMASSLQWVEKLFRGNFKMRKKVNSHIRKRGFIRYTILAVQYKQVWRICLESWVVDRSANYLSK